MVRSLKTFCNSTQVVDTSAQPRVSLVTVLTVVVHRYSVELCKRAFEQQSHFACFYAFVKLKVQERKNLYWITECIHQKQKEPSRINRWIKIF
jgi:vacuolar-type H+-ATPase subunit C/Vma6